MATKWNPADKGANITLSSTDHVATNSSGNSGVRSIGITHQTGKWYFEFPAYDNIGAGSGHLGCVDSSYNLNSTPPNGGAFCGVDPAGNLVSSVGTHASGLGNPDGHHVSMAVDFDNNRMWMRYDGGAWAGNGASPDPVTNTNGWDIGTVDANPVYLAVRHQGSGAHTTINAGDSAFTYTAPSGFTAWDTTPPFATGRVAIIGW